MKHTDRLLPTTRWLPTLASLLFVAALLLEQPPLPLDVSGARRDFFTTTTSIYFISFAAGPIVLFGTWWLRRHLAERPIRLALNLLSALSAVILIELVTHPWVLVERGWDEPVLVYLSDPRIPLLFHATLLATLALLMTKKSVTWTTLIEAIPLLVALGSILHVSSLSRPIFSG